jgi:hypothetical protein
MVEGEGLAPGFWESSQRILAHLITAEAKKQLGLPAA